MENPTKEYAKNYQKDGYSVIPVDEKKVPLVPWREFQSRRATEEEIDKWFEIYPNAQIGIVTGKISDLTVVDIEKEGDLNLIKDETYKVRTGGGGVHAYFLYEPEFKNAVRILPFVDQRSEGGYVVAAWSTTAKGSYTPLNDLPVARMSPETKKMLLGANKKTNYTPTGVATPTEPQDWDNYLGYGKGQRNDQMTRFIGLVLRRVHPAEWDTIGMGIIEKANQKNTPPLSSYELGQSYRSIRGREIIASKARAATWGVASAPLNLPEDGSDEVLHLAEVAKRQAITIDNIYSLGMPCFDKALLGGTLPGDLILIAGPTGQGKTSLMQDFAVSLMKNQRQLKVLLFTFEVLPQFVWSKFQEMGLTNFDPIYVPLKNSSYSIDWIEKKIKEAKEKYQISAVCIDHMGFLVPKQNSINARNVTANYSTYLTQVARELKGLAIREEVPFIVPTHVRKTKDLSLDDVANSAGLTQESDVVFLIERERAGKDDLIYYTDDTVITLAKNRRTGQTVKAWFTMISGRFAYNEQRNYAEELVNPQPTKKDPEVVKEVVKIEEKKEATVEDLFNALSKEEEVISPPKTRAYENDTINGPPF